MMGLKDWMLWLGWYINALIVNIISISIITLILKIDVGIHAIMPNSDWFLIWLFLFFYCLAGIAFCFAVSSFFERRKYYNIFFKMCVTCMSCHKY